MEFRIILTQEKPWLLIIIKNYITDWMMQFGGFHWLSNHRLWVIIPCSTNMVIVLSFSNRDRTGPGKPGKSWNFVLVFSRTRKSWKRATGPGKFWKLLLKTQLKNIKCMERSKENWHWDLGSVGVNVNFRALEKSILVLENPWKSPGNLFLKKGTNPEQSLCYQMCNLAYIVIRNITKVFPQAHF